MANFRWFTDDKTERVRTAKRVRDAADKDLHDYDTHQRETRGPGSTHDTPEYYRLNAINWDAHVAVKRERGW